MIRKITILTICVMLARSAVLAAPPGNTAEWQLVFSDEFEGTSVDESKWNIRTYESYWGNRLRPGRVKVQDGKLVISNVGGEGGWIDTEDKFTMTYGYIEARTRVSSATNKRNVWPCFWLKRGFPPGEWKPEYDIAEYIGQTYPNVADHVSQAAHFDNNDGNRCDDHTNTGVKKEDWGVFGVLIDEGEPARYYTNGELKLTASCDPQTTPTIAILHALTDGGSSPWPDFEVDWIRAWVRGAPCDENDTQGPTAPANLELASSTMSTVSLRWEASTDNNGVSYYVLYDGTTVLDSAPGNVTEYTFGNLSPSTDYLLTLKARDCVPNFSPASNLVTVTTPALTFATMPLKINVGGEAAGEYLADKGYQAPYGDYGYVDGGGTYVGDEPMQSGDDDVYGTLRSDETLSYKIFSGPGTFTVTLLFAEFWRNPGERVFQIDVNGEQADFDVAGEAGGEALPAAFRTTVAAQDNMITITLTNTRGERGNPILSGIEVAADGGSTVAHRRASRTVSPSLHLRNNALLLSHGKTGDLITVTGVNGQRLWSTRLPYATRHFALPEGCAWGYVVVRQVRGGRAIAATSGILGDWRR